MVRMEGRKGLFLVKRVNRQRRQVDLIKRTGRWELSEISVPLELIRTVPQEASEAIQQFLRSNSANSETAVA